MMALSLLAPAAASHAPRLRPSFSRRRATPATTAAAKRSSSSCDVVVDEPSRTTTSNSDSDSAHHTYVNGVVSGALACIMATAPVATTTIAAFAAFAASPPAAEAALSNPNTRLPRNGRGVYKPNPVDNHSLKPPGFVGSTINTACV
jgi:hypothetical protein